MTSEQLEQWRQRIATVVEHLEDARHDEAFDGDKHERLLGDLERAIGRLEAVEADLYRAHVDVIRDAVRDEVA